ncbi:MAG TPA: FAD-dependent oxidoreductase, partial [Patescibacteria group bacterium]|nr:FAD-dependent oxidoreductase [Patescibacteria group bacterium]
MEEINYLIIGGGVAGTTAAETIRKNDSNGSIAIVSDEPHRFYSRILLSKPNFFLDKIPFDQIWLKTEAWYKDQNIQLLSGKKAIKLDSVGKIVTLDDGTNLKYKKLLLAVGGSARVWEAPGADKRGVFYLRTLDDAKAVIDAVKTAKRAVAIGGGFVSFEMCEMLRLAGLSVSLVIREPHYWDPILDGPSGRMVESALEKGGVKIFRNA